MIILTCILATLSIIAVLALAVLLHNFLLLISEMNKRLIYIIEDMLENVGFDTPYLDTLNPKPDNTEVEDMIKEAEEESNYFNPHDYNPEDYEEIN